jgi:hypothetical protein
MPAAAKKDDHAKSIIPNHFITIKRFTGDGVHFKMLCCRRGIDHQMIYTIRLQINTKR